MIIAKNNEEKRSKVWRIVTASATVIIVVVAAYFLFTLFAGNPLEGTWASEESSLKLTIRRGSAATAVWSEIGEASNVKLDLNYTLDKEEKTITLKAEEAALEKAARESDGALTKEGLEAELSILENTFDYSLNQDRLTLAEREYGEQMTFIKE